MKQPPVHKLRAPELYGDFWFNSGPLTIHAMDGQVILLCFWDYTSEASMQMVKYVDEWYRRYSDMGLVVIGIHSPEFSFGRDPKLVEGVIRRLGLEFPVATDNTLMMRDAYRIQEIPTMVLLERDGTVYLTSAGERTFEQTERAIQALLREAGFHGELPLLMELSRTNDSVHQSFRRPTPSIRTGYLHGSLGNVEGYSPELPAQYGDPHVYVEGRFYAQGNWLAKSDAFEYDGGPDQGYVALRYLGESVGVVIASEKPGACVRIFQDGSSIPAEDRGSDISVDGSGMSVVVVDEPRLFHIIENKEFGDHSITLVPTEKGMTVYSFTFGVRHVSPFGPDEKNSYRNN